MYMICFCVPKVCQILDDTALNDKHNIKVMARSYQGHLKVKLAENSYNVHLGMRFFKHATKMQNVSQSSASKFVVGAKIQNLYQKLSKSYNHIAHNMCRQFFQDFT